MSDKTREDLLELLKKCNPRTRRTTKRVVEGKVSQDGAAFVQEKMDFLEPDMTVRSVDFISSRTCDAGHMLDQHTRLIGVCEVCGSHTCSTVGCGYTCARCGSSICRRHVYVYSADEAYCSRCHPLVLLKWLILGKRR